MVTQIVIPDSSRECRALGKDDYYAAYIQGWAKFYLDTQKEELVLKRCQKNETLTHLWAMYTL